LEKRRREQTRRQKQLVKQQRRVKRAAEKRINPDLAVAKDADLEGMVPGPQPGQIVPDSLTVSPSLRRDSPSSP
jgi:hypothetical protein